MERGWWRQRWGSGTQTKCGTRRRSAISRKTLQGREHLNVASALGYVADVFDDQGRHEEALEYYERALAMKHNALGKDHPSVAEPLFNLAIAYLKVDGKMEDAATTFEELARICHVYGNEAMSIEAQKRADKVRAVMYMKSGKRPLNAEDPDKPGEAGRIEGDGDAADSLRPAPNFNSDFVSLHPDGDAEAMVWPLYKL
jgi:tetratricopeptide (TPR) repeat protein